MSLSSPDSPQTTARLAGALWLIVIAVSIASLFTAPSVNINGSAAETAASILAAETPYRLAFALLFVGSLCYLGVTALLYELLRPVNRSVAADNRAVRAARWTGVQGRHGLFRPSDRISWVSDSSLGSGAADHRRCARCGRLELHNQLVRDLRCARGRSATVTPRHSHSDPWGGIAHAVAAVQGRECSG